MILHGVVIVALLAHLISTSAALLVTTVPASQPPCVRIQTRPESRLPIVTNRAELRRRQQSSAPASACGTAPGGHVSLCLPEQDCVATILDATSAYVFCSNPGSTATQHLTTASYASWPESSTCPTNALCCYGSNPDVLVNLFTASGYTVTGFRCSTLFEVVSEYSAYPNLINPAQFSVSLARITESAASTTSSKSSSSTSAGSKGQGTPTNPPKQHGNGGTDSGRGSGLPSEERIGIGAGIGGGAGVVAIAGIIFFWWWRNRKRRNRTKADTSSSEQANSSPASYDLYAAQQMNQTLRLQESYHSLGGYSELAQGQHYSELSEDRRRWTELPENQGSRIQSFPYELYAQSNGRRAS